MDYTPVLQRLKGYAKQNDLLVTWDDVKQDCSDALADLSTYHERKVHTAFATWITRRRLQN